MTVAAVAPELSSALHWLNAPPIRLAGQRGRVVALVFWHAGSAACENLLAELRTVQRRHSEYMTVIAIHTPKFEAERSSALVGKAINRLELPFPVALDNDFVGWQHYGIEAWPSVVLLDVRGQRACSFVGDLQREAIDQAVAALIDAAGFDQLVYESRSAIGKPEPALPLSFPAGIAVGNNHLYVADSGHHRVLECSFDGRILRQFGCGRPGRVDGERSEACLQQPRGLFLSRDTLYVADTGNHAIRTVRLLDGYVDTLAGTGTAGTLAEPDGRADNLPLHAPWALAGSSDRLYIAMAGARQVWELDQSDRSVRVLAGNGRVALLDGGMRDAAFAQPADIALAGETVYVADAGASAIRSIHLPSGHVYTLMGQGLYEFGAQDGGRNQGRLQYPCALALDPRASQLWIADTYNDRLRSLRIAGNELRTHELDCRLQAPAAIAHGGNDLWIANTDAHEVLRCDPSTFAIRRLPIGE